MAYGVTTSGFIRKTRDEVLTEIEDSLKAELGSDIVLDADQPLGQIVGIIADAASQLWEGEEGCLQCV